MSDKNWITMKFGGSSLQNASCLNQVAKIIASTKEKDNSVAVVCSAMGETTNMLLEVLKETELTGEVNIKKVKNYHYTIFEDILEMIKASNEKGSGNSTTQTNSNGSNGKPNTVINNATPKNNSSVAAQADAKASSCNRPRSPWFDYSPTVRSAFLKEKCDPLLDELHNVLKGVSLLRNTATLGEGGVSDLVVSFGERLSVQFVALVLREIYSVDAKAFNSWDLGFVTTQGSGSSDSVNSSAKVSESSYFGIKQKILENLPSANTIPVITGYIAKDDRGKITTLGRDGSDLTASILGAALDSSLVMIYKDVDGVLTADPRIVPDARPVHAITYNEAAELAYFGAKVVHPSCIIPIWSKGIPMYVKNFSNPSLPGTKIVRSIMDSDDSSATENEIFEPKTKKQKTGNQELQSTVPSTSTALIRALSCKRNVIMVDIESTRMLGQDGFLAKVFKLFADYQVSVDMIASSDVSVSLTLDKGTNLDSLGKLSKELRVMADVKIQDKMALIALVVPENANTTQVILKSFKFFEEQNVQVDMLSIGASKVNITFLLKDSDLERCVIGLHNVFFGQKIKVSGGAA